MALLGASPDTVAAQAKFASGQKLPFPLLADADRALCRRYGVLQEKSLYGRKYMGVVRSTFLLDADGAVAEMWTSVKPIGHAKQVLQALQSRGWL